MRTNSTETSDFPVLKDEKGVLHKPVFGTLHSVCKHPSPLKLRMHKTNWAGMWCRLCWTSEPTTPDFPTP